MFQWMPYAMVRVTLFMGVGILLGITLPLPLSVATASISLVGVIALFTVSWACRLERTWLGAIGLLAVFMLGFVHVQFSTARYDPTHLIHEHDAIDFYVAEVVRYNEEKVNSWRTEIEIQKARASDRWKPTSGRVLLYLAKTDYPVPFRYGDVLLIRGEPNEVSPPMNPGEFDWQRFLMFKNIYHQQYVRRGEAFRIDGGHGNGFVSTAIAVREWADRQLRTYVKGEQEQATASALVLGVSDRLDGTLLQAYASTGAMHVLAVSGLHVSIVYGILVLLGRPLEKTKAGQRVLAVLSVVLLWCYAFITGWSPSVLRAVTMFSFVALARPWKQSTNIYNTMAASAFCLLLYDPFFIMSVGFQLSYLAVFGIVFLHAHLYRLWEPESRFWDEVWKVVSVSVAAQISTLSISLYYFHQFPVYFLLANMLVIPVSFVVLVGGLAVLPATLLPWVAACVGFFVRCAIKFMNFCIVQLGNLPGSVVTGIYVDGWQSIALSILLLGLILTLLRKGAFWARVAFVGAISFAAIGWRWTTLSAGKDHLTIYHSPGQTHIEFMSKGWYQDWVDSMQVKKRDVDHFHRIQVGSDRYVGPIASWAQSGCSLIYWKGIVLLVVREREFRLPKGLKPDLVVLANGAASSIALVAEQTHCNWVVIDSSNSFYIADKLLGGNWPDSVHVFSIPHRGAFQMKK